MEAVAPTRYSRLPATPERTGASDRAVLQALLVAVPALFLDGRRDRAIADAHRGVELARRLGDEAPPWSEMQLSAYLGSASLVSGRLDEAEALAQEGYQQALGRPWPVESAFWAGWRGQVIRVRGRPRTALRWLREATTTAERWDVPLPFMPAVLGELAHAAALLGDLRTAEGALARAEQITARSAGVFQLWVALARPWVAAARGEVGSAITLALELAKHARDRGQLTFQILALHDVARLGRPRQVDAMLRALVPRVDGQLAPLYAAHATALASKDAVALDEIASAFACVGVNLLAAEAAAEAADAHRAAGRRSSAVAAGRRAATLAVVCEGAHTPALDVLRRPPHLTPREQEIAGLAARGLSSRAIAERLVISVRTVDNALQHVYGELGLTTEPNSWPCCMAMRTADRTVRVTFSRRRPRRVGLLMTECPRRGMLRDGSDRGHRGVARGVRRRRSRTRRSPQQCRDRRTTRHRVRGRRTAPAPRGRETRRHPCRPRTVASNTRRHSRPE